jgi:hypothetical protein
MDHALFHGLKSLFDDRRTGGMAEECAVIGVFVHGPQVKERKKFTEIQRSIWIKIYAFEQLRQFLHAAEACACKLRLQFGEHESLSAIMIEVGKPHFENPEGLRITRAFMHRLARTDEKKRRARGVTCFNVHKWCIGTCVPVPHHEHRCFSSLLEACFAKTDCNLKNLKHSIQHRAHRACHMVRYVAAEKRRSSDCGDKFQLFSFCYLQVGWQVSHRTMHDLTRKSRGWCLSWICATHHAAMFCLFTKCGDKFYHCDGVHYHHSRQNA